MTTVNLLYYTIPYDSLIPEELHRYSKCTIEGTNHFMIYSKESVFTYLNIALKV